MHGFKSKILILTASTQMPSNWEHGASTIDVMYHCCKYSAPGWNSIVDVGNSIQLNVHMHRYAPYGCSIIQILAKITFIWENGIEGNIQSIRIRIDILDFMYLQVNKLK